MSFYRSDPVGHYKLIIPREDAWNIMNMLGELDMVHFVKSDKLIEHNPYTQQIKRCEESLARLNNLERVLHNRKLYTPTQYFTHVQLKQLFNKLSQKHHEFQKQKSTSILNEIEEDLHSLWNTYNGMRERYQLLTKNIEFYRENISLIVAGQRIFGMQTLSRSSTVDASKMGYFGQAFEKQGVLRIDYGIIEKSQQAQFERVLFRISRGHSIIQFVSMSEIFEDISEQQTTKIVYFLIFQGKKNSFMQKKLTKVTQNYNKFKEGDYQFPISDQQQKKIIKRMSMEFNEAQSLLKMVESQMDNFLREKLLGYDQRRMFNLSPKAAKQMQKYCKIEMMKIYLLKELQIYNNLKEMDVYNNFLQGEIYLRYEDFEYLKQKVAQFQKNSRHPSIHIVPIDNAPGRSKKKPTCFQRNSYTRSAQDIVQTYGIARYREANPSLFTTVTFPFLFGVMFGDMGHGLLLFLFGLLMVWKKYEMADISEMFVMLVPHRYLFALMGFFSTYCGFIYNDFLSINLNLFGSCYNPNLVQQHQPIPRQQGCIYPFGIDPVWGVAENNLNYINSLKMKISVIIGVVHMTLGVIVKASNSLYFRRKIEFWFETIPQLLFLVLVFGYMDFLIIFKWLKAWGYGNVHAPSIITTMINLPLMVGKTDKQCCHGGQPMWGDTTYTSQEAIQKMILFIVFLCVPIMLLVKPIYEIRKHNAHAHPQQSHQSVSADQQSQFDGYSVFDDEMDDQVINNIKQPYSKRIAQKTYYEIRHDVDYPSDQSHEPSEIFVHQMIETIQFVLGCISNTASYLRLWALSLAHSQLAEVFMEKTLVESFEHGGNVGIIQMLVFFPMFAGATFGVLMCMDVMQCFLHTLRLHWVQFQNKFYKGDGYAFAPFSFYEKINTEIKKTKLDPQVEGKRQ